MTAAKASGARGGAGEMDLNLQACFLLWVGGKYEVYKSTQTVKIKDPDIPRGTTKKSM